MARLLLLFLVLPLTAAAADEGRISFLEQEVRNLQRQVQAMSRQLDELQARPERLAPRVSTGPAPRSADIATNLPRWVDASAWKSLRPGMSELEVIDSLGPPNSIRAEGDARILLYALEIGSSGFLGGSVKVEQHAVVEVRKPTLQ